MLTGLIGNGLAFLVAGVAVLIARFRRHAPGGKAVDEVLLTASIVGMLLAGELARSTGIGSWTVSVIHAIEGLLGSSGPVLVALSTLGVLLLVGVAVFRTATERALILAFVLPFLLAMFGGGIFHSVDMTLQAPAQATAARIASGLGV